MQQPQHLSTRGPLLSHRLAGLALAGIVPAAFIVALVSGLIPKITIPFEPPIDARIIPDHQKTIVNPPPPGPTISHHIDTDDYPPPKINTDSSGDHTITIPPGTGGGNQLGGAMDTPLRSVASTHTTPRYPSLDARLGRSGTVTLRIAVAADGSVTDASVVSSSGSDTLDAAAIAWVKSHWRYEPATRNGVAVATTTEAAVRFDLKNASR